MNFIDNKLFAPEVTDFYKLSHILMHMAGETETYSNFTPRSGKYSNIPAHLQDGKVLVVGTQATIKKIVDLWNETFFNYPRDYVLARITRRLNTSIGPNQKIVDSLMALYDLGYLPLVFKSIKEGKRVNYKVPVMTIRNTHPDFAWLTNYLETPISNTFWKLQTSANTALEYQKLALHYADNTGASKDFVKFQMHDFSFRGLGCMEDAFGQMGHLIPFVGTDTIPSIGMAEYYYNANAEKELVGTSVPASEHARSSLFIGVVVKEINEAIANGVTEYKGFAISQEMSQDDKLFIGEVLFVKRYCTELFPSGIRSYVADTYDFWKLITEVLPLCKEEILATKKDMFGNAKLVVRPDSGVPEDVICGTVRVVDCSRFSTLNRAIDFICDNYLPASGIQQVTSRTTYIDYKNTYYAVTVTDWGGDFTVEYEVTSLTPQQKGAIRCLWEIFGGSVNNKGYKELNPYIGLIYGDSITLARAEEIFNRLYMMGFASTNVVLGVGSFSYVGGVTRDTHGTACKSTNAIVDGKEIPIYKDPKTDSGKKSAKGYLRVELEGSGFVLYDQQTKEQEEQGQLITVWKDGSFVTETSLAEIRSEIGFV